MWEALISSLFAVLKEHFDHIIMRIMTWILSFILCWLYLPVGVLNELLAKPLPALPPYTLVYLFYFVAATAFWQVWFIFLEVVAMVIKKVVVRQAIQPPSNGVEINQQQNQ